MLSFKYYWRHMILRTAAALLTTGTTYVAYDRVR
jgi:hypothetical protein